MPCRCALHIRHPAGDQRDKEEQDDKIKIQEPDHGSRIRAERRHLRQGGIRGEAAYNRGNHKQRGKPHAPALSRKMTRKRLPKKLAPRNYGGKLHGIQELTHHHFVTIHSLWQKSNTLSIWQKTKKKKHAVFTS